PGRQLGSRPIGPVLGDHLLLISETGAEGEEGRALRLEGSGAIPGWPGRRSYLGAVPERERRDVLPLAADERLGYDGTGRFDIAQRLPLIRVRYGRRVEAASHVHRLVRRNIAGVIGVSDARLSSGLIAQLVRTIFMPVLKDRPGGHIPNPGGSPDVGRRVGRVVTQPAH